MPGFDLRVAREKPITVETAIKLAEMTVKQACERAYRDTELQIRDAAANAKSIEDKRSVHRNANRTVVLLVGFAISLLWPFIAIHMFHSTNGATFASALGYLGDIGVTTYALIKHY